MLEKGNKMNQRISRNNDKKNNLDFVSLNTGGQTVRHVPNEAPQVQVQPQKVTGETKPEPQAGAAKASPNFKPVTQPEKTISKEDEKKAIATNSTPAEESKEPKE